MVDLKKKKKKQDQGKKNLQKKKERIQHDEFGDLKQASRNSCT